MHVNLGEIPVLGVGIGLREEIKDETILHNKEIDVLELITEQFTPDMSPSRRALLDSFHSQFPLIPHGVGLSIGSAHAIPEKKIEEIKWLCDLLDAPYYSEHFSLNNDEEEEFSIGHLSPIWHTDEELDIVVEKILLLQERLNRPIVLENITSSFDLPESDYTETEFITKVCDRTSAGLLLDVTNVYINAYNRKKDPLEFLKAFPLERVVQMHLAGGELHHDWFSDTHSQELSGPNEPVWQFFEYAVAHCSNLRAVIIERDQNFGSDFEKALIEDVRRIRRIWHPVISSSAKAPQKV